MQPPRPAVGARRYETVGAEGRSDQEREGFLYKMYQRMCSLTIECVLLLQNMFSYYRICSLTIECALLL